MKILATTVIISSLGVPALAGGLSPAVVEPVISPVTSPVISPAVAPAFGGTDWSGGYVGAHLAYGSIGTAGDVDGDGDSDDADDAILDANGGILGLYAGYLHDFGRFVLGAELGLNAANVDFDSDAGSVDSLYTLRMKAGFEAGRSLIYGTFGVAYTEIDAFGVDYSDTGYAAGIGMDYLVTENVIVGADLTYHKFDDIDGTGVDFDMTTVGLNVAYKF